MIKVFDNYARYYDLLYQDKDYIAETIYVTSLITKYNSRANKILELGCGTGAHAEHLARMGYTVHGVDMSEEMLNRAEARKAGLPSDVASRLSFSLGDVRSVRMNQTYDVVLSLFHVMSYQSSNNDLDAAFDVVASHLSPGGLFLFDYWYGPAVLIQKPEVKVRRLEDDEIKVTRIAEPIMNVNDNVVDVNYTVFIEEKKSGHVEQIKETHRMRYFFLPELQRQELGIFKELGVFSWMTDIPLSEDSWAGFQVLEYL